MNKTPKFPVYDPEKDGNRFEWVLKQAAIQRERQAEERRNRPRYDPLTKRLISTQTVKR
ncbi:MAG: hypothetical protein ACYC0P_07020 [Thiobacillus sp.]